MEAEKVEQEPVSNQFDGDGGAHVPEAQEAPISRAALAEQNPTIAEEGKEQRIEIEEREEGEVDEELARSINSNLSMEKDTPDAEATKMDSEEPESSEEESSSSGEEEDNGETMEDSEPLYSSNNEAKESSSDEDDVSDEEDWRASLYNKIDEKKEIPWSSDDEDDGEKPSKTINEITNLPHVPKVDVELQPHHTLVPAGKISSVLGLMIIVEGEANHDALDEGSILWLSENRAPLGFVDEVFGPVKKPFYVVRFNDESEIPLEAQVSTPVAFVPDFARAVLRSAGLYKKGYDASGLNDEELSEDQVEFSDDEKEAEFKREKKRATQQAREDQGFYLPGGDKKPRNMKSSGKSNAGRGSSRQGWRKQNPGGNEQMNNGTRYEPSNIQQRVPPGGMMMPYSTPAPPVVPYWPMQHFVACPGSSSSSRPEFYPIQQQNFQQQQFQGMEFQQQHQFQGMGYPGPQFYGYFPAQQPGMLPMVCAPGPGPGPSSGAQWWPPATHPGQAFDSPPATQAFDSPAKQDSSCSQQRTPRG